MVKIGRENGTIQGGGNQKGSQTSVTSSESSHEENTERGNWSGSLDFIMSCVSYAVGLGNIWRFPYLCYRNGGGVFLIPYVIFLLICGMPLFFLEVSYGQFASLSPITVWHLSPLFKGIGYGMVIISGIVCIYYNIIITWAFYFLFSSFTTVLPWSTCDNEWNTENCVLARRVNHTLTWNATLEAMVPMEVPLSNQLTTEATAVTYNYTHSLNTAPKTTSPSEEFWERRVLQLTDGIDDMGGMRWELFGCLVLSWLVVFLVLFKGIKSSGKVMYFTATFPYMVLTALLVRGVTLPGASKGLEFYLVPQWDKLLTLKVWGEAAMQIFYSVGAAWGALITMASYNKFHNNCYRDALIIPLLNCGTSVFAGFTIFSIIGFMAHETGSTIHEVISEGPGLVFIVYPAVLARFPIPQIWAVLFFLMLLSVGVGSQVGMFQTLTSAFIDEFDVLKDKRLLMTGLLCFFEFLMGVPCVMQGGIYYLQIMDWYSATFSLMILSFSELIIIAWVYGVERFYKDIELMIGFRPSVYWKVLWCFITPVAILFVLMFSIVMHTPVTYDSYVYPTWAVCLGMAMALCSIVPLPVLAIIAIKREEGPMLKRMKKLVYPSVHWGPALEEHRELWIESVKADGKGPINLELVMQLNPPCKIEAIKEGHVDKRTLV